MRPISRTVTLPVAALAALLAGCSSMPSLSDLASVTGDKVLGLVTPYRVEVVQGNVLTKELVSKVKPGMPRAQIRDLLGSPMLADAFHEDRWDYVFTIQRQGAPKQHRKVVALFEGDKLKTLEVPDDLPSENEFVAAINTFKPTGPAPKLSLTEAERKALPTPAKSAEPTQEPIGPVRTYPPLEPRT
ncbi:outer membrane protein assembly factor BamE [Pelomonas sp. SE-A7]|uniref:outer membrane protein assembly factor BamE n=1 Tax=Pelomonas sp. SE-A7 TaxID=3054953 RepID=UPI00259C7DE9|nr:outer membrane protein assembly factor BamE [Pelomonas sp. SE-A7]MDM4766955.1 outer membrane protein assembly factor BamE [Pelomonas sp. SE-A7]